MFCGLVSESVGQANTKFRFQIPIDFDIFSSDNQFCGHDQDESVNLVKRYLDLINVVVSCPRMLECS